MTRKPDQTEAAPYYFTYIDKVPAGDIRGILESQLDETAALFSGISEEKSRHRYAPDKWSIREVLNHLNDNERVFLYRALWFARGFADPLPSFDEKVSAAAAGADEIPLRSHLEEFRAIRSSTVAFFRSLPEVAWSRRGVAGGKPVTVNALAYIAAGHVGHHAGILKERYL
jgi:hypothetical protein